MKTMQMLVLVFGLVLITGTGALADGLIPTFFYVAVDDDVFSEDMNGTISEGNLTSQWNILDSHGEVTLSGSGVEENGLYGIQIDFDNTGAVLPLSVSITSTTASPYAIITGYNPTVGDFVELEYTDIVGDIILGTITRIRFPFSSWSISSLPLLNMI